MIISVIRVGYHAKLTFLLLLQYACGMFSVLLLWFRESLKVKLLLCMEVLFVVLLLVTLYSLKF
jgi:hypothetical protein